MHEIRSVRVEGQHVLCLHAYDVAWWLCHCDSDHPSTHLSLGLLVGALASEDEEPILKDVYVALTPKEAFELGSALQAASNQMPAFEREEGC